jgi:cytoskeletal protein CcmA (bactofilin family)
MALNTDFRVKDSLYVGNSACFVSQTDTPKILSAGEDLLNVFIQQGEIATSCDLTSGTGIATFCFNGAADRTVSIDSTCNSNWNSAYDWCQANSATVLSAATYVSDNGSALIDTVAEGNAQGKIAVTNIANSVSQVDVNGLQTNDSPQFAGACYTGAITTSSTVDGRDIACDGATLDTLRSLSGDNGLTFSSPSQGTLRVTEADGDITNVDLGVQTADSVQFVGACYTGNITIDGTVDGRDVAADGTTLDTLRPLTATNVTTGSSPAQGTIRLTTGDGTNIDVDSGLQSGDSVQFVGACYTGNITIDGTVDGRDIAADAARLAAIQGLSAANLTAVTCTAQGTLQSQNAAGTCTAIDTGLQAADSPSFAGLNLTSVTAGTDNSVLVLNGTSVATDEIDSRVWNNSLVGGSGTCDSIPIFTGGCTLGDSCITQDANGVYITGGLSAGGLGLSGDGSHLTNITADQTVFPTTAKTDLASGDKFFINDGTDKHVTYCALLTDLAGTDAGIEVDSSDSLALKNYSNITTCNVPKWDAGNGMFSDSLITETSLGNITIAGGTTITGNLSVQGDLTCIDTTVSVTSALSVVNAGTGPAIYAEQAGSAQPIAIFKDTENLQTVIGDTGNVGIGFAAGKFAPAEKLTVNGNLSANGNAQIDGTFRACDTATFTAGVNFCGVTAGTDNSVIVLQSNGSLATDEIDSKVWEDKLVDSSSASTCSNQLPKFSNSTGTIGNSNIADTGSIVTIDSDTVLDTGHKLTTKASASVYSEEASFTDTVDSTPVTVTTFAKSGLKSVKYHITLVKGVNITTFEVNAVHNGTDECGTVYGIVDAQTASQLDDITVSSASTTLDLNITAASDGTTAIIQGTALYS